MASLPARRTGLAHLPLHGGRAPRWLFRRMTDLARAMVLVIRQDYSAEDVLRRMSDPFWFQAFGCVLGFDWHSSGLTTTVCGALKEGLRGLEDEAGLYVAGGKGATSRKTPAEVTAAGERIGLDPEPLVYASRMAAKVDSAAVQDGYQLYHHTFMFTTQGAWAVVQQGMSDATRYARRYHWLSEELESYVEEPHAAVAQGGGAHARPPAGGYGTSDVLNLVAAESAEGRRVITRLAVEDGPDKIARELGRLVAAEADRGPSPIRGEPDESHTLDAPSAPVGGLRDRGYERPAPRVGAGHALLGAGNALPELHMPAHHPVTARDVNPDRIARALLSAYEQAPDDFEGLLALRGVGAKTLRALSLVAELVHGVPLGHRDPALYSFAHGGKDGYPYPVDRAGYDETVDQLTEALRRARLRDRERLDALRRLAGMARATGRAA